MNTDDNAVKDALDSSQCPAWANRWLLETQGKEQCDLARYIEHGDVRGKLYEQDRVFDDELNEEESRLVNADKARTPNAKTTSRPAEQDLHRRRQGLYGLLRHAV